MSLILDFMSHHQIDRAWGRFRSRKSNFRSDRRHLRHLEPSTPLLHPPPAKD